MINVPSVRREIFWALIWVLPFVCFMRVVENWPLADFAVIVRSESLSLSPLELCSVVLGPIA